MNINIQEISTRPILACEELYDDIPAGIRFVLLILLLGRNELTLEEWLPYYYEANRTYNKMIIRQQEAEKLESIGELNKAVELYGINVRDCYHDREPYSRLFSYYSTIQQSQKAQWVCLAFIEMANIVQKIDPSYNRNNKLIAGVKEFREKLENVTL